MRKFLQVVAVAVAAVSLGVAFVGCTQSSSKDKMKAAEMKKMETKMDGKMESKDGKMETKMDGKTNMEAKKDDKMEKK